MRETQEQIGEVFVMYFQCLFTTEIPRNLHQVLSAVKRKVTPKMNNPLLQDFSAEEVGATLAQMSLLKEPSPNGFNVCFH
jgi:hypothetical protein